MFDYDIALPFAGEQQIPVEKSAACLKAAETYVL
jgi:hypothetical protein